MNIIIFDQRQVMFTLTL